MNKLLLAAVLLVPAAAHAAALESLSAGAARDFALSPAMTQPLVRAEALIGSEPVLQPALEPQPLLSPRAGAELARVSLASILDRSLHVKNYVFGSRALDFGVATDTAFKSYYLAFTDGAGTALTRISDFNKLRSDEGLDVKIDKATTYNFRAEIASIFNDPIHNSVLHMHPVTGGPSYDTTTGEILDAIRAQSVVLKINGAEYWMLYGRNALPDGGGFAATRSFLFIKINTMAKPQAWPLAESALAIDTPYTVDLGGVSVQLTRTSAGDLIANDAN